MPTCPNCGSYVSPGSPTCSCGTSFSGSSSYERETENPEEKKRRELARQYFLQASSLEDEHRYAEALRMYEKFSELRNVGIGLLKKASLYYYMGDYESALEICRRSLDDDSYDGYRWAGMALRQLKRYDEAFDMFFKALDIIENSSKFVQDYTNPNFGRYYTKEELDEMAREKTFKKWEALAEVYKEISLTYKCQKNYKVSLKYIDEAISLDGKDSNYPNVKAIILEDMHCYDESKKLYDKAVEMDRDNIYIENRARMVKKWCWDLYGQDKNLEKALKMIRQVIDDLFSIETEEDTYEYVELRDALIDKINFKRDCELLKGIGRENLITIAGSYHYDHPRFEKGMILKLVNERTTSMMRTPLRFI